MKESSTYQAILEEGRAKGQIQGALAEAKRLLRQLGEEAFGPPDAQTTAFIEQLDDLPRLEAFLRQTRTARNWREVFNVPAPSSRKRRRV
jgi:predicted transposase YdaD